MKIEYEVKVLEIDVNLIKNKLNELNAIKLGDFFQKRYVYDFNPKKDNSWIRLRNNGKESTLTIKEINSNKIDGTNEIEIKVDDFEKTNLLLEKLGFKAKSYQENKRISYLLNNVEIDIDFWPLIPPYLEIEGRSIEDVKTILNLLNLKNFTSINTKDVYKKYNIDIDKIKELKF